jgi:hypothetical protein
MGDPVTAEVSDESLRAAEQSVEQYAQAAESEISRLPARTAVAERTWARRFITKIALGTFVGSIAIYGVILIFPMIFSETAAGDKAAERLLDLIKTVVVPVTTLVIGHYIGSSKQDG